MSSCNYKCQSTYLINPDISKIEIPAILNYNLTTVSDNDLNEETIDGKHTTHATNMVVYQQKQFGPLPQRGVFGDHSKKKRSLDQANLTVLQEFSSFGKRPLAKELVGNVHL